MIRTKTPIFYEDRGDASSVMEIEIHSFSVNKETSTYLVHDFVYKDDKRVIYKAKEVVYPTEYVNGIDAYIEANYDLSGLPKIEKEYKKLQIALFLDTTTKLLATGKTIYRQPPANWELMPAK